MLSNCCEKPAVKDLTNGLGKDRNYYCMHCKSHWWRGKQYDSKTWDRMMDKALTK